MQDTSLYTAVDLVFVSAKTPASTLWYVNLTGLVFERRIEMVPTKEITTSLEHGGNGKEVSGLGCAAQ